MAVEIESGPITTDNVLARVPAFPPVVLRLLDLLSNETTETAVLVRELASDAALTAELLRLANSPLFGLSARVETVHQAVVSLGFSRVQSLVMAAAATNYMKGAMQTEALQKCWRHTLASAVLCREIARATGIDSDRAYSFGLLHDLGRLGLLVGFPEEYDLVLRAADRDAVSLLDMEKKRFGLDHCEAGRQLVELWKLPQEFRVICGRHHDPPDGAPFDLLTLVHASCQLADTFGYAVVTPLKRQSFDEVLALLPAPAQERLCDADELGEIVERAVDPGPSSAHVPLVERIAALPEKPALSPILANATKEPIPPKEADSRPTAWELPILFATALVMLAALAAACFFSRG